MPRLSILFLTSGLALMAQTSTGSMQGAVMDASSSKPIGGAFVTAIRSGLPPVSQTVQTGADGSFQLNGLPAGAYSFMRPSPGRWLPRSLPVSRLNPHDFDGRTTIYRHLVEDQARVHPEGPHQ